LAVLAAAGGGVVSRDRIAEFVAGGLADGSTVRTAVSRVRKVLGERVVTDGDGYRLVLADPDSLDAVSFEDLIARARGGSAADRRALLTQAVRLWRGPAFDGVADEPWAQGYATRLDELRILAVEDLAEALLTIGSHGEAISLLEAEQVGSRLRERPVGLLMRALASSGRPAEALRAFQRFRAEVRDALGIEPTAELRALEARILDDEAPEDGPTPASERLSRTTDRIVGNVPSQRDEFVGRETQVAEVSAALGRHRVVTLLGVGGVGKTRLALEVARSIVGDFPDGCWYVELATVAVNDAVEFALAAGLGVRTVGDGSVIDAVVAHVRHKRLLIVVDNCEHVLGAAAEAIETVVGACEGVAVLSTSREPLLVHGERLVPIVPLSQADAEQLFVARALAEDPQCNVDGAQAEAIGELCERLDRLPLAIELAASRVRAFTPLELAASLDERFRLLVGGRRNRLERHQTMRGALDWSYQLCDDMERTVFDRLSVFPASFDLALARVVVADDVEDAGAISELDVIDTIARLLDRSLVQRSIQPDGTSRYALLETMRAYGREHLQRDATGDDVRRRHAHHIARTIDALGLRTIGPDEKAVRKQITRLLPDSVAAFTWFVDHHDWDNAYSAVNYCWSENFREEDALKCQLREVMIHEGAEAAIADLDPDMTFDPNVGAEGYLERSADEYNRKAWALIDGGYAAPAHRGAHPPHVFVDLGYADTARSEDLVATLPSFADAPLLTRLVVVAVVALDLAKGRPDLLVQAVAQLEALAEESRSETARTLVTRVLGEAAFWRCDWVRAASCFDDVLAADPDAPRYWSEVSAGFRRLAAKAGCDGPIQGSDLVEPWVWMEAAGLQWMSVSGACATAIALDRLSEPDLARGFRQWVVQSDPEDLDTWETGYGGLGLKLDRSPAAPVDLDVLLAELFQIAERIDDTEPATPSSPESGGGHGD
jgi:predicted ATPase/DNA-binding SARP family transcriptional activator